MIRYTWLTYSGRCGARFFAEKRALSNSFGRIFQSFRQVPAIAVVIFLLICAGWNPVHAQEETVTPPAGSGEVLQRVEVEPPEDTRRRTSARTGSDIGGFGADQPSPGGLAGSDFALSPGEVVSPTRRPTNLSRVNSAIGIVENQGVESLGYRGVPDMLQGQVGLWTSGFSATPFDSSPVIRGFSNESPNRVSLLYDGRSLNVPRTSVNYMFIFPELIDRIEILRGDGTVQFGNKAIGGAINVIPKRPRQNPGVYAGAEIGSWHTDREWTGFNCIKGPLAAGVFLGRYWSEGFRLYQGNGIDEEFVPRPGPWALYNFSGTINWKITPRLTFDVSQLVTDQRNANADFLLPAEWERRDLRDIQVRDLFGLGFYSQAWDGPTETWDAVTIAKLLYDGGSLGDLEVIGSYRRQFRRTHGYSFFGLSDDKWFDTGVSVQYSRDDTLFDFFNNVVTVGVDWYDGFFGRESRSLTVTFGTGDVGHSGEQSGYRESLSYYILNTATFWERVTLGFGWRFENYDLKDLFANDDTRTVTNAQRLGRNKSATQWSVGLITDKELGSSIYYRHSRTYRFPNFDDMVNFAVFGIPPDPPFWLLDPDEGTLDEVGIRHWLTRNIYLSAIYYELDMDNEILFGQDELGNARNTDVRDVSHHGVELETMIRITPRWTLKGNYTRQRVRVRSDFLPVLTPQTTQDKWLYQNPADMANLDLTYNNEEWGFSATASYHYIGSSYRTNDVFNIAEPLDPAKWGDIAFQQKIFGDGTLLYFGINNVTDRQYALWGTRSSAQFGPISIPEAWWPNAGRTYYGGFKTDMDFQAMKMPTTADIERMQRRLYGLPADGMNAVGNAGRSLGRFVW